MQFVLARRVRMSFFGARVIAFRTAVSRSFLVDESFDEDADQLRRAGLIVLRTMYVQVHLHLKLGDLVHPLSQFLEDDVALVNGISC